MPLDLQTSFAAGELSPSLHSHADLAKYRTGLAQAGNFFILAQGGAATRAGFEYVHAVDDPAYAQRVVTFSFNTEQSYVLVLTNNYMRIIRNGGVVLEPAKTIVGVTNTNPVVVTSIGHGFATFNEIYITGVNGMPELNDRYWRISVLTPNAYELYDVQGAITPLDGTAFGTYLSNGTAYQVAGVGTPWPSSVLFDLKFVQSADVMTITHPDYPIQQLSRTSHHSWTLTPVTYGSEIGPPTTGLVVNPVGSNSGSPSAVYRYVITSVTATGDESVQSAILDSGDMNALNATYGNKLEWDAVSGAEYYNIYKEFSVLSGIFGWLGESAELSFHDYNFGPDMSYTPPMAMNPFNGANDYPACTEYHQQRQWFGCTNNHPDTMWATRTADYDNMDVSRPTRADDAIHEATLSARQVNEIRHLVSLDDLLVFTSGGEWKVQADADGVITPGNLNVRTQGFRGCSKVRPLVVGDTALFVQEKGSRVRDIKYTFESDKYSGNDLTVLARHLFEGHEIVDWCYAQEPFSIVWAVRDDGALLSLTYLQEHDVYAWTAHITQGYFESICAVSEGLEDAVYAVVRRTVAGRTERYVERMKSRLFESAEESFCVDSGLTYRGESFGIAAVVGDESPAFGMVGHTFVDGDIVRVTGLNGLTELNDNYYQVTGATAYGVYLLNLAGSPIDITGYSAYVYGGTMQRATSTLTGLHHLRGSTVTALCDGNVDADLVVASDGTVELTSPACVVHIGLAYGCQLKTLEINFQGDVVQSRKKQVVRVTVRVENTRGLKVGPTFDSLYAFKERTTAIGYGTIPLLTGEQTLEMTSGWTEGGQVCIAQYDPLPATVLAIIPEIVVGV